VWNRVHDVPDFAYFPHDIHVARGVACATCHGDVAQMPLTWKSATLYMEWCLNCHRNPEKYVGPPEAVFTSASIPEPTVSFTKSQAWTNERGTLLTNCSICHY
jgi:hypothetical protein